MNHCLADIIISLQISVSPEFIVFFPKYTCRSLYLFLEMEFNAAKFWEVSYWHVSWYWNAWLFFEPLCVELGDYVQKFPSQHQYRSCTSSVLKISHSFSISHKTRMFSCMMGKALSIKFIFVRFVGDGEESSNSWVKLKLNDEPHCHYFKMSLKNYGNK